VSAPLPSQAMRAQVASGYTAGDTILVISPLSLSSYFTFLCIAAGWVVVYKKGSHHKCETQYIPQLRPKPSTFESFLKSILYIKIFFFKTPFI
jgi:hypothetical protein